MIKPETIMDRPPEPRADIRNYIPDVYDEIKIEGNIKELFTKEELEFMNEKMYLQELGYDGEVMYIILGRLFGIDDVKARIKEIMEGKRI